MIEIYPRDVSTDDTLPNSDQFTIASVDGKLGKGIWAKVRFERGTRLAHFIGTLSDKVFQHTLQVTPEIHLHDPHFVGLMSHSCAPNCVLDMPRLEVWALTDIEPGDLLTIDYAMTEDRLFRQFPCHCGTSGCRRWITGRHETVNDAGKTYLAGLPGPATGDARARLQRTVR